MRCVVCVVAASLLVVSSARAEDVRVKDATVSIELMTFYSGQRNRFPHWGSRMDCPTASDRPAGSRDKWLENLCGAKASQKPVVKQIGGTTSGGTCGYSRYAVACLRVQ